VKASELKRNIMPTYCGKCKTELDESSDSGVNRKPCPRCGSKSRNFVEQLRVSAKALAGMRAKHRRGSGKPIWESRNEPSFSKKSSRLVRHERTIDRENDLYREVVTDLETGKIIHQCKESLSEHVGHGSAKPSTAKINLGARRKKRGK
jgi:DNA-directed RNA polymerase subunit RPC12/RpoP